MAKQVTYTVRGSWPFPLDMLRYDGSAAASDDDRAKIDLLSQENAPSLEALRDPVEINLVGPNRPTTARWASFCWAVTSDVEFQRMMEHRRRLASLSRHRDAALAKLSADEIEALEWFAGTRLRPTT